MISRTGPRPLHFLDQDSLLAIVERLPLRERFRLEITCRALAAIIRHPSLWRKVSFVQLIAGPETHRHPAGVPEMYDQFHVYRSLPASLTPTSAHSSCA